MNAELQARFTRDAFADLTALIPVDLRARIGAEVTAAIDQHGVRRDLRIAVTGDSPRRYRVVPRDALVAACPSAAALYRSRDLLALVAAIAGEAVVPVPYAPEELIATRLEDAGDTHGWHWDDYGLALVWVVRAPAMADGGALEYVTNVPWSKADPDVAAILARRERVRARLASGSVYLLRADTTLHRVSPLQRAALRDAVCFSYALGCDLGRMVTHESLDAILG